MTTDAPTPGIERIPAWKKHPWLRAGFSTRLGGASTAYGPNELNLGWTASDAAENVTQNRARFLAEVAAGSNFELVAVRQTHSTIVRRIDADHAPLMSPDGKAILEGDGLITDAPGIMLGVQIADCVPVLVIDPKNKAVAAFHAGWRGTAAQIVAQGVERMRSEYASNPADLEAAIGPSIGPCCFEVGDEVRAQFGPFVHGSNVDLWQANRQQLLDSGLNPSHINVLGECSACTRGKYFSHRAEKGFTGRMMALAGIIP